MSSSTSATTNRSNNNGKILRKLLRVIHVIVLLIGTLFATFGVRWFVLFQDDFRDQVVLASRVTTSPTNSTEFASLVGGRSRSNLPVPSQPDSSPHAATKVAYMLSITACSRTFVTHLHDAAAVWKYSIESQSYPQSPDSQYRPEFFAVVPPYLKDSECARILTSPDINMTMLVRDLPVLPADIVNNTFLQRKLDKDGCCGHRELLKLYAYTMTEFEIAVHLDLDTLVLQPLDELLDAMHYSQQHPKGLAARAALQDSALIAPTYKLRKPLNQVSDIAAFYTRDYNMLPHHKEKRAGVQGGFLIVKPNQTIFHDLVSIVKGGNFTQGRKSKSGWMNSGFGQHIWGGMTVQGLLGYYFWKAHVQSIELHRCKFNQIADNPRRSTFHATYPRGTPFVTANVTYHDTDCKDGRSNCDDVQCQTWPIEDTRLVHFTTCKAPWTCPSLQRNETWNVIGCRAMHRAWYETRERLERERGSTSLQASNLGTFEPEYHLGYCKEKGSVGYIPMVQ